MDLTFTVSPIQGGYSWTLTLPSGDSFTGTEQTKSACFRRRVDLACLESVSREEVAQYTGRGRA